jgi:Ser-tRNA(Ala) deacylase AlaX
LSSSSSAGGQPFDKGLIVSSSGSARFQVREVRQKGEEVLHIGVFDGDSAQEFAEDETVEQEIEEGARRIHARLHSAGHLLDVALKNLGHTELKPGKGYHFPDGPYVEYEGSLDQSLREDVRKRLEQGTS